MSMNPNKTPQDKTTSEYWNHRAKLFPNDPAMLVYQDIRGFPESQRLGQEMVKTYAKPGMNILDAGCGAGRFAPFFKELGLIYTGVDASEEMIKLSQKNNSWGDFYVGEWRDLPNDIPRRFDIVFECICLSSFKGNMDEFREVLSKMLNPGGVLIMLEATEISVTSKDNIFAR